MAGSSKIWDKSKQPLEKELPIESGEVLAYNSVVLVSIRSLIDAQVKVTGTVTGNQYIWARSGAEVEVDARDKDEILNKKRGRACCGGQGGKSLFELV